MGEWVIRAGLRHRGAMARRPSRRRQYFGDPVSQSRPDAGDRQRARGFRPRAHAAGIEITESVLHNKEATLAVLHQLRACWNRIAMDDFGTAIFVADVLCRAFRSTRSRSTARSSRTSPRLELAHHRAGGRRARQRHGHDGYRRGRGNRRTAPQHRLEGCTEMQGFLFSKPLPAAEIERQSSSGRGPRIFKAVSPRPRSRRSEFRGDLRQHSSRATRLAGPSNSLSRASCLLATSFLARQHRPSLSVRTRMCERRSLVERILAQRPRLSSASSIETKFGLRMPSVLAISVWLRPGLRSSSSSTENCAGVSCSGDASAGSPRTP